MLGNNGCTFLKSSIEILYFLIWKQKNLSFNYDQEKSIYQKKKKKTTKYICTYILFFPQFNFMPNR